MSNLIFYVWFLQYIYLFNSVTYSFFVRTYEVRHFNNSSYLVKKLSGDEFQPENPLKYNVVVYSENESDRNPYQNTPFSKAAPEAKVEPLVEGNLISKYNMTKEMIQKVRDKYFEHFYGGHKPDMSIFSEKFGPYANSLSPYLYNTYMGNKSNLQKNLKTARKLARLLIKEIPPDHPKKRFAKRRKLKRIGKSLKPSSLY